jgi:D-alanyl-D-alanine carboxypeptidase (penicillin-binding protein 5/6)
MVVRFRIACLVLTAFTFILVSNTLAIADITDNDVITAKAYVLMDADSGKVLKASNEHLQLPPASMTKLMTLVLTMEALENGKVNKNDQVITSEHAWEMDGTTLYLAPGEVMSLDDMLMGIALGSANDASVAVAEYLTGSENNFVAQMNQKAMDLGMKDTYFQNVSGLPAKGHYSSAYDMAVLAKYALAHTRITDYTSLKQCNLRQGKSILYNTNKLLWRYQGADGLKTGYTTEAKHCLIATAKRDNLRLIAVVMACPQMGGHLKDAMALLDYGFDHYTCKSLLAKGSICGTVKVEGGVIDNIEAITADEVASIYLKGQEKKLKSQINLNSSIKVPVKRGQKLGEVLIFNDKELLKKVDAVAVRDVPMASTAGPITQILRGYVFIILLLMAAAFYFMRKGRFIIRGK